MVRRKIFQGEAKTLPLLIKDKRTGQPVNLTGSTYLLWVKRSPEDDEAVFVKEDADFMTGAEASGYVTTFLTAYDTYREPWVYQAELRVIKVGSPAPIEKLAFELEILRAITPNQWVLSVEGIASLGALGLPAVANI